MSSKTTKMSLNSRGCGGNRMCLISTMSGCFSWRSSLISRSMRVASCNTAAASRELLSWVECAARSAAILRAAAQATRGPCTLHALRSLGSALLRTDTCSNTSLIFLMATRSPTDASEHATRRARKSATRACRAIDGGADNAVAAAADHLQDGVAAAFSVLGEERCRIA